MKKKWIATVGMAVALSTGGTLLTALPAAADPPDGGCPMLNVGSAPGIEHISDQGLNSIQRACKRWIVHH